MDIISTIIDNLMLTILLVDIVLVLVLLFWERNDPKDTAFWIVILLILPLLGFVLYLFFGQTFYSTRTFKKKAEDDERDEIVETKEKSIMREEWERENKNPNIEEKLKFINTIKNAGGMFYTNTNEVDFLPESNRYFDSLLEDLSKAEKFIHFEYYIMRNDEVSNKLMDILIDRAKNGVEVRLMLDAIGNNKGPKKKIRELKAAGGEYSLFHSTATCLLSPRKNNRNHRKIAVIDCKVGYVGGYNIGDEYLGKGPLGFWRDSAIRIHGPEVIALQFRFLADWRYATKKDITYEEKYYEFELTNGDVGLQLVSGGPDTKGTNPIQMQYLSLVSQAKKTMYIHTPYLEPNNSLADALRMCAFSGVDVRIIIPNVGDHPFVFWANRFHAHRLMLAGVRVYEYDRGFVHSKTFVSDSKFCSVGSANVDDRSMVLNFETNAMIYSERIGKEMTDAFLDDLNYCTEYTIEKYDSRTIGQRFKTSISRLFSGQL